MQNISRIHPGIFALIGLLAIVLAGSVFVNKKASSPVREGGEEATQESASIRLTQPKSNSQISSPVTITGEARGSWYFEGTFPIRLLNSKGDEIARANAIAQSEWMTENFVPFEAVVTFTPPEDATGALLVEKANPSGLDENSDYLSVPIRFYPE